MTGVHLTTGFCTNMRVQIFADIHGDIASLQRAIAAEADIYIAAGDLVTWPAPLDVCGEVLKHLGNRLWVMPGNNETDEQIKEFCDEFSFQYFHEVSWVVQGTHFGGLGYSNNTPFNTPGEYSEEELAERLARFKGLKPQVLVCHAPPLNTELDEVGEGMHFGSSAIREFIDSEQPDYFFCGHIHEAAGRLVQIGSTMASNVGKPGYLLEL